MTFQVWTRLLALPAIAVAVFMAAGCNQGSGEPEAVATADEHDHDHAEGEHHSDGDDGHNLHGYWCVEHGVPEEICAQCNTKLAAEYQQQGDWCEEHSRPDSQCFIHHPELEEKFVAQYEAKFGKKPPTREAE